MREEEEEWWLQRQETERYPLNTWGHDTSQTDDRVWECAANSEEDIIQQKKKKRGGGSWQKLEEDSCVWVCLPRCPLSASHWNSGQIQTPRLLTHFRKHHTPSFFPENLQCRAWLTIKRVSERARVRWRQGRGGDSGYRSVLYEQLSN